MNKEAALALDRPVQFALGMIVGTLVPCGCGCEPFTLAGDAGPSDAAAILPLPPETEPRPSAAVCYSDRVYVVGCGGGSASGPQLDHEDGAPEASTGPVEASRDVVAGEASLPELGADRVDAEPPAAADAADEDAPAPLICVGMGFGACPGPWPVPCYRNPAEPECCTRSCQ